MRCFVCVGKTETILNVRMHKSAMRVNIGIFSFVFRPVCCLGALSASEKKVIFV